MQNIEPSIKKLAHGVSVLLVDDDELTLEIYKSIFSELFLKVFTASDGLEAYNIWSDQAQKIDLIITDIMMPNLDGFGLIDKIRQESSSQHIMIVTSLDDLNEMKHIINLGVDGVIMKPFEQEKVFPVLQRVLNVIRSKKIMKRQIFQLKLLSQEKIALKANAKSSTTSSSTTKPKIVKEASQLSSKYNIRKTISGSTASTLINDIDYLDADAVDAFTYTLHEYESLIVGLESKPEEEIITSLQYSTKAITQLVQLMDSLGYFDVAVEAGENLIAFIHGLDAQTLKDKDKKELFFDAYLSMFQDIDTWLKVIFINKEASNINYFDASFANTCLELETIFANTDEDDSELEFF